MRLLTILILATCTMQLATCPAEAARRWPVQPINQAAADEVKTGTPGYQSPAEQLLGARVTELPNDAGRCFTSVYISAQPSAREQQVAGWFAAHRGLQALAAQTHYNVMHADNPLYQVRHAKSVGDDFPCVTIQHPDGRLIAKVSGANMPATADGLATILAKRIEDCRPRPKPTPTPTPVPQPQPVLPDLLPDVTPQPAPEDEAVQWLVVVVLGLVAAGGTLWHKARRKA